MDICTLFAGSDGTAAALSEGRSVSIYLGCELAMYGFGCSHLVSLIFWTGFPLSHPDSVSQSASTIRVDTHSIFVVLEVGTHVIIEIILLVTQRTVEHETDPSHTSVAPSITKDDDGGPSASEDGSYYVAASATIRECI